MFRHLAPGLRDCWSAPATLPDAATAASWSLQRSCNAPGCCNCCFLATATLLQRSRTLQLLLPGHCNAPATLPDTATAASWPLQRSCNAPRCCNCCFLATATLLQRSQTLQLLLPGHCNALATLPDDPAKQRCLATAPGRCNCCFLATATLLQCFWTMQLYAATDASWPQQHSFWSHITLWSMLLDPVT